MAEDSAAHLHRFRIDEIKNDPTVVSASTEEALTFVEADLLYHDLSAGHSTEPVASQLDGAGGRRHSAESWVTRIPGRENKGIGNYLNHLRDDLQLELWEFPAPTGGQGAPDVRTVAKQVRESVGPGAAPVHHVPIYPITPVSFGPFGAPTPVSFGGAARPDPVSFGGAAKPDPVSFGGARPPASAAAQAGAGKSAREPGRGACVKLAVLDTGIPQNYAELHPYLEGSVAPHCDPEHPMDSHDHLRLDAGHGLFIMDVACRLAPSLKPVLMRRPTRNDSNLSLGEHLIALDLWEVVAQAISDEYRLIVNMSFAAQTVDDKPGLGLLSELTWLANQGADVLVVAAAGNGGDERKMFPAACELPNVVSVGALDASGHVASFSSRGDWVDCWTTGSAITGAYLKGVYDHPHGSPATFGPGEPWAQWSGTSFAAPRVVAAIARKAAEMPGASLLAAWETLRKENRGRHPHWSDSSGRFFTETGVIIDI
jgi:hypothetical protein